MDDPKQKSLIALKKAQSSINRIIKQVEGDAYCINILQQLLSAQGLIKSASNQILSNHLHTCFQEGMKKSRSEKKEELIQELLSVINYRNKS